METTLQLVWSWNQHAIDILNGFNGTPLPLEYFPPQSGDQHVINVVWCCLWPMVSIKWASLNWRVANLRWSLSACQGGKPSHVNGYPSNIKFWPLTHLWLISSKKHCPNQFGVKTKQTNQKHMLDTTLLHGFLFWKNEKYFCMWFVNYYIGNGFKNVAVKYTPSWSPSFGFQIEPKLEDGFLKLRWEFWNWTKHLKQDICCMGVIWFVSKFSKFYQLYFH